MYNAYNPNQGATMTQTPYPAGGALIDWHNGEWQVPDNPWIGCIAGDGIGPEIMQAARRV